jgi:hypothetical protein
MRSVRSWIVFAAVGLFAPALAVAQEKKAASEPAKPAAKPAAAAPAPAPAAAAPTSSEALAGSAAKTKGPAKPQKIDFEDEMIRGTLTRPEGDFIGSSKGARQKSLIKIRKHFVPELLKSADEL